MLYAYDQFFSLKIKTSDEPNVQICVKVIYFREVLMLVIYLISPHIQLLLRWKNSCYERIALVVWIEFMLKVC